MGLVDADGSVVSDLNAVKITGQTFDGSLTFVVPSNPDNYVVVAIVTENNGVYDSINQGWIWSGEEVILNEGFTIMSSVPIPVDPQPGILQSIVSFFQSIGDWIRGLAN